MICRAKFVLNNSIRSNNTILSLVKFSDLMRYDIIIPNIQRILDMNKVNEIIKLQKSYYDINIKELPSNFNAQV